MRELRIFSLHFIQVFEHRARIFVWFIIALFHPLTMLMFWRGVFSAGGDVKGWTMSDINTYYLLCAVVGGTLIAHVQYDIANLDIQEGQIVKYLIRPFSYFRFKLVEEMPWRIIQSFYSLTAVSLLTLLFGSFLRFDLSFASIAVAIFISIMGFFISFTFTMILGILAFWIVDMRGLFNLVDVIVWIFGGFVIPVHLFPEWLSRIAYLTPFPSMIYYPVMAFQGKGGIDEALRIAVIQCLWFIVLYGAYRTLWRAGLKKSSGEGQ